MLVMINAKGNILFVFAVLPVLHHRYNLYDLCSLSELSSYDAEKDNTRNCIVCLLSLSSEPILNFSLTSTLFPEPNLVVRKSSTSRYGIQVL